MTQTSTEKMWNLTADQWSAVLESKDNPEAIAARLRQNGMIVPWSQILLDEAAGCVTTADLGCGRGEHSAVLARAGRTTTLIDWSHENLLFCRGLYGALGLHGHYCRADITRPLPLESNSVDMVFSSGVFEYFNPSQIDAIMSEAFRIARKRVIIMVPNSLSIAYRLGKWYMERTGTWEWGGEVPSVTLKPHFQRAGGTSIREYSVGGQHSLDFLAPVPGGARVARVLTRLLRLTRHPRPTPLRQGYLLVTIGDKPAA
jgi:SAM-dependent methyltransferase